ncbi:hypothetical protein TPHA_0B00310 [Tetrapisispora phaffii CBS 4417]|uniref:DHHA2 domain-containing protein n=1 Tax=Tetrapisispora phaffii (strain ATCC 24235 / CBS 4417 / NBRC 1672 / NRRL Y-8282 / UCD 70-5) TaxID=1071381 RepID=G8BQA6_TETPH|nr:hypothetical protein TPHA_0B00310 [Tetrapisispora phaffii CBS 4417]CCE61703.1 hypothetical protein TPHA_0B00310 [Tetrapisispora phaffii CBS 4417]
MSINLYIEGEGILFKSISLYLSHVKNAYFNGIKNDKRVVNIVCGNEAADFDSIACAISYSYYSFISNQNDIVIPIIDIPIVDFNLRRDVVYALDQMNIKREDLFFRNHLIQLRENFEQINVILSDHNKPSAGLTKLTDKVVGILDHHQDSGLYLDVVPRFIELSGSCSSLVFKYWYERIANLEKMKSAIPLCLGAGVIDTTNFTNRCIDIDLEALKLYKEALPNLNIEEYFKNLKIAKDNIKGLTIKQILKKDYKHFTYANKSGKSISIGISSIVKSMDWLYNEHGGKSNFLKESEVFLQEMHVDIFVIMTSFVDINNKFNRELVIIPSHEYKNISVEIIKDIQGKLGLQPVLNSNESDAITHYSYSQLNLKASRKQVAPFLEEAFNSLQ